MNNTNKNQTDSFFRQGLNSPPEFIPTEKNWKEMEQLLQPYSKRRLSGWMYFSAGIAAALLAFLSFWLAVENKVPEPEMVKSVPITPRITDEHHTHSSAINKINKDHSILTNREKGLLRNMYYQPGVLNEGAASISAIINDARLAAINSTSMAQLPDYPIKINAGVFIREHVSPESTRPQGKKEAQGKWALSLSVAPDLNSVKSIKSSAFGLGAGLGISYAASKSIRIGTGVYYASKLYSADKYSYKMQEKPFATWASYSTKISADCRVIDVPLNMSIRVSNTKQSRIYAMAGLSSYIMLSEKYKFLYSPTPSYPSTGREYTIHNQNKHILSVVNLGIAIEKPLTTQASLVVQPYAKLPMTGIGQGKTDLKSFGIEFKLNYSLKKKNGFFERGGLKKE